jgi:carbonic anhydrase/acetyltransferase-like protein (isoleucine patch superfamily)
VARWFPDILASGGPQWNDETAFTTPGLPRMINPTAFIAHGAVILGDVHLGRDSSVWYNTVIRADVARISVGDETNIQDLSMLHADEGLPCSVGNRVTVGHRVILHGCTVEDECLIGMGAILLNRVRVGRGSVIGAGALLLEGTEVPPGSLVVGFPGKVVRPVDDDARKYIEQAWQHYVSFAQRHRCGEFRPLR